MGKSASRRAALEAALAQVQAPAIAAPAPATIKLDLVPMTAGTLLVETHKINEGLNGNLFYPNLPETIRTALSVAENDLLTTADNLAAAEQYVKSARAAQQIAVGNARTALRTAATGCETEDRSVEALVSVGWNVRRPSGPPKPLAPPRTIALKNTSHEGEVEARWPRITNTHFYEIRSVVSVELPDPHLWEDLPIKAHGPSNYVFKELPVGQYLCTRVRAVGAKGPSAWSEAAVIRVN